jgi:exodeoxyribonuclease-3
VKEVLIKPFQIELQVGRVLKMKPWKLISWNVNGLRSIMKKGCFEPLVSQENPTILCLQEVRAEADQVRVDINNMKGYWNPSKKKKGQSGTAIFSNRYLLNIMALIL